MPKRKRQCDLLLHGGHVFTMDDQRRVLRSGTIAVDGGHIAAVGSDRDFLDTWSAHRVIDLCGAVVHPGLIEPHLHVNMYSVRTILTNLASQAELSSPYMEIRGRMDAEDEHAAALLAGLDLLSNGFTAFADPGTVLEPDAVATAAEAIGIRTWLADPYIWDEAERVSEIGLTSPALLARTPADLDRSLAVMGRELKRNSDPDALVRGFVALYADFASSDALLCAARDLAQQEGAPLHMHVSFLPGQTQTFRDQIGTDPVLRLARLDVLGAGASLVHLNVLSESEIDALAHSRTTAIWVPANAMRQGILQDVPSPFAEVLRCGAHVTLASDLPMDWSVSDTALVGYLTARAYGRRITVEKVLEMQTRAAARALGAGDIGSLEPGKRADIVVRAPAETAFQPAIHPLAAFVLVGRGTCPWLVIVDGEVMLEDGLPTRIDADAIGNLASRSARRLLDGLGYAPKLEWPVIN